MERDLGDEASYFLYLAMLWLALHSSEGALLQRAAADADGEVCPHGGAGADQQPV